MDKLKVWEAQVKEIQEKVNKHLLLTEWKFVQGIENGELPETDDSGWAEKKVPLTWSMKSGTAYFRKKIILPSEIEGIPTEGSNVNLTFHFHSGVELFIDGERAYSHRYWAERTATPLLLMKKACRGERRLIVFKAPGGDGLGTFWAGIEIDRVEDILFELNAILYQVRFAFRLAGKNRRLKRAAENAVAVLQPEKIAQRRWKDALNDIREAEKQLEVFRQEARKFCVHLIGHAHIDMNWLWGYEDTVHICLRDFETVNKLMEKYPDLTFSQSQAQVYRIVEDNDRVLLNKVREKIKEGRWDVTASSWVECDLNMSDGESIARHALYAGKYTRQKFGVETKVFWSPDTFGHPETIPSILAGAGLKYYYFMRCGREIPLFRWKGRDGREILAFNSIYINRISPETLFPDFLKYYESCGLKNFMFVYGVGDHGGGPTEADIRRKKQMEEKPVVPSLEFSTTREYFSAIERHRKQLPVISGELNTIFEGCYTTHSDIKRANRDCERMLLALEALSAVVSLKGGKVAERDMETMWHKVLFNQFHDILDGSAIHSSYDYSSGLSDDVKSKASALVRNSVQKIAPAGNPDSLFVFNPLGWERTAVINSSEEKLCGYGYKTISAGKAGQRKGGKFVKPSGDEYENEFYRIRIDGKTGLIRELYDKKNRSDVLSPCKHMKEDPSSWWAEKAGNLMSVSWEKPHPMSAWIIGNIYRTDNLLDVESMETEESSLRTVVKIGRRYMDSRILQKIILYPDFPFIDFENEIDWRQQGNDREGVPMVRVNFNVRMKNPKAFFEVPFGTIQREVLPKEYPALKWAGFNSGSYWTALFNRNKHGYRVDGNNLSLTLLRNPYEPDAIPDSGIHSISYRLFFGKSDILSVTKAAWEYNFPPVIKYGRSAGREFCPFTVKGDILPTSFKKALDRDSCILRLVELLGRKQSVEIECAKPVKKAYLADIAERRNRRLKICRGNIIRLRVNPFEILTLDMEF